MPTSLSLIASLIAALSLSRACSLSKRICQSKRILKKSDPVCMIRENMVGLMLGRHRISKGEGGRGYIYSTFAGKEIGRHTRSSSYKIKRWMKYMKKNKSLFLLVFTSSFLKREKRRNLDGLDSYWQILRTWRLEVPDRASIKGCLSHQKETTSTFLSYESDK